MAGIYIHIPFCKQACTYCNFHFTVSQMHKAAMVRAIVKEIHQNNAFIADKNIETIYIGGGTPSICTVAELALILNAIYSKFGIIENAEITLEANPDDISVAKLQEWKKLGINRLSVGVQSFNDAELKWMNRAHHATQSLQCIADIKAAGFTNYSVDFIFGSPLQTNQILQQNIEIIAAFDVPHVSCYALTVEKKTTLSKLIADKKTLDVDADKQAAQFYLLLQLMEKYQYLQYEISSFCKPNYQSRHNSSYWQGKAYYGFGPSAHAYNGNNARRWNMANNGLYIQATQNNIPIYEEETLTEADQVNEYVMTALRTSEGINLEKVKTLFGALEMERIFKVANKNIASSKVLINTTHIKLTNEGKFFADGIAGALFK